MRFDHLTLALLWIAYCAIHSALISIRTTDFFKRVLGTRYCYYRLSYNIFSLVTLILLLLYSHSLHLQSPILLVWSGNWRIIQYALFFVAVGLIVSGLRHYSISQFLGIHQIRSGRSASGMAEGGDLDTSGVLGYVRHPWYVAVFLFLWTSDQNIESIIINGILSAYLLVGTLLEERKLILEFGEKYQQYQKKVPMLIPFKWPKNH